MKRFFFILFLMPFVCIAQGDSVKVKELIYNRVYKNIAAYYISYYSKWDRHNGFLVQGLNEYHFDRCLPDKGWRLDMDIIKLGWKYPINGYVVYKIKLNELRFKNDSLGWEKLSKGSGGLNEPPSSYNLLCINKNGVIKFISGGFFIHDVSDDFKLNNKNPETYLEYLKYRTFEYQIVRIAFLKRKRKKLIFSGYSEVYQDKVLISVDPKNPGRVDVLILNGK